MVRRKRSNFHTQTPEDSVQHSSRDTQVLPNNRFRLRVKDSLHDDIQIPLVGVIVQLITKTLEGC